MKKTLPLPAPMDGQLHRLVGPEALLGGNSAAVAEVPANRPHVAPELRIVADASTDAWLRADLAAAARHYLRARRAREALFPDQIFADPAWDMLLELFASSAEGRRAWARDLSIAANVPATTAQRWLARLEELELVRRRQDPSDARNEAVTLTSPAIRAVGSWLEATFGASDLPAA